MQTQTHAHKHTHASTLVAQCTYAVSNISDHRQMFDNCLLLKCMKKTFNCSFSKYDGCVCVCICVQSMTQCARIYAEHENPRGKMKFMHFDHVPKIECKNYCMFTDSIVQCIKTIEIKFFNRHAWHISSGIECHCVVHSYFTR